VKRRTKQRDEVRDLLDRTPGFASAQDLHQALRDSGSAIGLATVYRALTALADEGVADSLTREGETVYRACRPGHHHHLVCRRCGATTEISAEPVEEWASGVAKAHGYFEPEHVVDVFGLCPDCHNASTGN
jgi:Fur family ferric uptake transcriptional regulator